MSLLNGQPLYALAGKYRHQYIIVIIILIVIIIIIIILLGFTFQIEVPPTIIASEDQGTAEVNLVIHNYGSMEPFPVYLR